MPFIPILPPIVSGFNAPTVKQKADNLRVRLADDGAEPSSGDK